MKYTVTASSALGINMSSVTNRSFRDSEQLTGYLNGYLDALFFLVSFTGEAEDWPAEVQLAISKLVLKVFSITTYRRFCKVDLDIYNKLMFLLNTKLSLNGYFDRIDRISAWGSYCKLLIESTGGDSSWITAINIYNHLEEFDFNRTTENYTTIPRILRLPTEANIHTADGSGPTEKTKDEVAGTIVQEYVLKEVLKIYEDFKTLSTNKSYLKWMEYEKDGNKLLSQYHDDIGLNQLMSIPLYLQYNIHSKTGNYDDAVFDFYRVVGWELNSKDAVPSTFPIVSPRRNLSLPSKTYMDFLNRFVMGRTLSVDVGSTLRNLFSLNLNSINKLERIFDGDVYDLTNWMED